MKFDCGSLPFPRLWNGPPKLSVIGALSVLEPDGSTLSTMLSLPLLTLCAPPNVCFRSVAASSELPPHAAQRSDRRQAGRD